MRFTFGPFVLESVTIRFDTCNESLPTRVRFHSDLPDKANTLVRLRNECNDRVTSSHRINRTSNEPKTNQLQQKQGIHDFYRKTDICEADKIRFFH